MKLEAGMYVRTKEGYIAKCTYIDEDLESIYVFDSAIWRSFGDEYDFIHCEEQEKYIIKTSHNIIDLIEKGDYVNGSKVIEIEKDYKFIDNEIRDILWLDNKRNNAVWKETIKSIVTKEQFSSMAYKLGDDK